MVRLENFHKYTVLHLTSLQISRKMYVLPEGFLSAELPENLTGNSDPD